MVDERSVTCIALLRGINNAGSSRRVAMADLRALFENLGFSSVRTLLNSGNVIFTVPTGRRSDLCDRIEKALASGLELTSRVIILSADEIAGAVRENPFYDIATNPSHLLVCVPRIPSDLARLKPLLDQPWAPEALAVGKRVAYLWCANGVARSPIWAEVERALDRTGTVRNINTLSRASALIEGL